MKEGKKLGFLLLSVFFYVVFNLITVSSLNSAVF